MCLEEPPPPPCHAGLSKMASAGTPPNPARPRAPHHPPSRQVDPTSERTPEPEAKAAPILAPRAPSPLNTQMSPGSPAAISGSSSCPIGLNHSMTPPASLTQRRGCLSRLATWYLPKIPQALSAPSRPRGLLARFSQGRGGMQLASTEHPSLISTHSGSCSPAG